MTRSRQDVMDDLRDLLGCEDIELSVLIAEALEHLEASQKAFELLGGE